MDPNTPLTHVLAYSNAFALLSANASAFALFDANVSANVKCASANVFVSVNDTQSEVLTPKHHCDTFALTQR